MDTDIDMDTFDIIVVDDSATIQHRVRAALALGGFNLIEAMDGVEGLAAIRANPTARLVICDQNMPRLDGLAMLEVLHTDGCHLPILMLTHKSEPELVERARALGVKAWITKPFQSDLLFTVVKRLTGRAQ